MTAAPTSASQARILRLLRWKRWIIANTLVVAAGAVIISLLLSNWYQSETSVFPPEQERSAAAASLLSADPSGSQLSMSLMANLLGGGSSFDIPIFATPSDIMARILRSRPLEAELIETFDLMEHYEVETMDDALETLSQRKSIFVSREGFVIVVVEETDPQLAADIANEAIRIMDEIQRGRRHTAARTAREFVERRLAETRRSLAAAEESLQVFQQRSGIVAPEAQADAMVEVLAELMGRRLALEVQLETLRQFAGPDLPRIARLEADLKALDETIARLGGDEARSEADAPGGPTAGGPGEPGAADEAAPLPHGSLSGFSDLMLEYQRRFRDVKMQETLHEYLLTQYEFYRIQEVRDTPTIQVLEPAVPAEEKSRPKRSIICIVATLLAFAASVVLFELLERLRDSARTGGVLSILVEGVGGGFLIRKLRDSAPRES
ncbi:MAG: hypothetical protein GF355_17670 [Candidatus Eisenbacteria bacterium]|nr:hypothetical protein [Candidatus Eisenbacteria bacterium]